MEEELYYIREFCGGAVVEGCESMTTEQVDAWMSINQISLDEETSCGDSVKYIRIPVNQIHN
jgi:hypothetical protein